MPYGLGNEVEQFLRNALDRRERKGQTIRAAVQKFLDGGGFGAYGDEADPEAFELAAYGSSGDPMGHDNEVPGMDAGYVAHGEDAPLAASVRQTAAGSKKEVGPKRKRPRWRFTPHDKGDKFADTADWVQFMMKMHDEKRSYEERARIAHWYYRKWKMMGMEKHAYWAEWYENKFRKKAAEEKRKKEEEKRGREYTWG